MFFRKKMFKNQFFFARNSKNNFVLGLKQHNLKPNEQFFTTIATPFARNGDIPKVERIIGMLRDEGLKVNSYSYGVSFLINW